MLSRPKPQFDLAHLTAVYLKRTPTKRHRTMGGWAVDIARAFCVRLSWTPDLHGVSHQLKLSAVYQCPAGTASHGLEYLRGTRLPILSPATQ
jgi:hypothetical protein